MKHVTNKKQLLLTTILTITDMRFQQLNQEMNKLYDSIEELQDNPESKFALKKIKALLRKESRFAAFKRNYIRENRQKYPLLLQYIS